MSNLGASKGLSLAKFMNRTRLLLEAHLPVSFIRRRGWLIAFVCLLMVSCGKKELPPGVLTQEQMAPIVIEIYLAEARLSGSLMPRDSASAIFKRHEQVVLQKAGIADSTLRASYQYYLAHPEEFEKIYDVVIDSLSLREQRAKKTIVQ